MSDSDLQLLKADFLAWTGGFEPETEDDIETYIATSMPSNFNADDAAVVLREWLRANLVR